MKTLTQIDALITKLDSNELSKQEILSELTNIRESHSKGVLEYGTSRLWELVPEAVAISDSEGIVIDCNKAYLELYEIQRKDVLNKPFYNIFKSEFQKEALKGYKHLFNTGNSSGPFTDWVFTAKNKKKYVESYINFIDGSKNKTLMLSTIRDITDEKHYQTELENLKNKYEIAIKASNAGTWIFDSNTNSIEVNDNSKNILDLGESNIINASLFFNNIHPEDKNLIYNIFYTATNKDIFTEEVRVSINDDFIWIKLSGKVLKRDKSDLPETIAGIDLNINEFKLKELELNESKDKLSFFLDSIPMVVWTSNKEGDIDFMNKYGQNYFGEDEDKINAELLFQSIHPNDKTKSMSLWEESLASSSDYSNYQRIKDSTNSYKWFAVNTYKFNNSDGWFGIARDIDKRYELTKNFDYVVNHSRELISVYSDFQIRYITPASKYITDMDEVNHCLNQLPEIIHPEDSDEYYDFMKRWRSKESTYLKLNTRIINNDSNYIWVEIRIKNHYNEDDEYISVCVIRNINDAKVYENEIVNANKLSKRIISLLSHDLTNSIGSVMGLTNFLVKDNSKNIDNDTSYVLNRINDSIVSSYELLNNVLLWAKNKNTGYSSLKSIFNLNIAVDKIKSFFETKLEDRNLDIINKLPKSFLINTDQVLFESVLRNLISNAIKFSNENTSITIDFDMLTNTKYSILITNKGVTLSKDEINNLLNPDFDRRKIKNSPNKGAGLGLTLIFDFLNIIEGKLEAISNDDTTTFIIILDNYVG